MKQFAATLQTHLDSGTTTLAWCWRLTRNDGAVFGFTSAPTLPLRWMASCRRLS